jgi:hypothetical protein
MTAWTGKPCARCDKQKGPTYADRKYCYRCAGAVRKEAQEKQHRTMVARVYSIGRGDYDRLYEAQGGVCALCQVATGKARRLSVDHDHTTGEVRGILCRPCNDMLGHGRDQVAFFERVIWYLVSPPARLVLEGQS